MTNARDNDARGVSVALVRRIAAPIEKVFRAWTDPRVMAKWLAPGADAVTSVTADVRVGGRYRLEGRHAEGASYAIGGTYLSVQRPTIIEMSWFYEGPVSALKGAASIVNVEFVALDEVSTELTVTHERCTDREAGEGNRVNWLSCLDKLERVAGAAADVPDASDRRPEFFSRGQRAAQDRFATRKLADRLEAVMVHDRLKAADAAFVTRQNMFFLGTVDVHGQPNCSYKGGATGFVTVIDDHCIAYPDYDGNGMHISIGNIDETAKVGLLFVDFDRQARMRVLGTAHASADDRLLARYPGARTIVRVDVETVFSNCPRYVHRMALVEESSFIPDAVGHAPVPAWKRLQGVADVLSDEDAPGVDYGTDVNKALNRDS